MATLSHPLILVTGAEGFIGSALCDVLLKRGNHVRAASRFAINYPNHPSLQPIAIGTMGDTTDWHDALHNCNAVVHTAARVHVMQETETDPLTEFRRTNVEGTLALARQALAAGVQRFIYISTAKVLGEGGPTAYTDASLPAPKDAYAISKWEAEQGLRAITAGTTMQLVILRPSLVFGPGVKANFLSLMRSIGKRYPLPFGGIKNRRSFLYLGNLIDAIALCLIHPAAANSCFLLADPKPLSTPALVRGIADALGCRPRLFTVPPSWLRFGATLLGKRTTAERLLGSLELDVSGIQHTLGWCPPVTTSAGLKKTAEWFKAESQNFSRAGLM